MPRLWSRQAWACQVHERPLGEHAASVQDGRDSLLLAYGAGRDLYLEVVSVSGHSDRRQGRRSFWANAIALFVGKVVIRRADWRKKTLIQYHNPSFTAIV